MIILPRLLQDLLREAEAEVAHEFALRLVERVADRMDPDEDRSLRAFLAGARTIRDGGSVGAKFRDDRRQLYDDLWASDGFAREVRSLAQNAVNCVIQRELEGAGVQIRNRYQPSVGKVAIRAQKSVKIWAVEAEGRGDPAFLAYEEARWQVLELIRLLPNPTSAGSEGGSS